MIEQVIAKRLNEIAISLASIAEIAAEKTIQQVIRPEEIGEYLSNGWRYLSSFSNSRDTFIVVEIKENERR